MIDIIIKFYARKVNSRRAFFEKILHFLKNGTGKPSIALKGREGVLQGGKRRAFLNSCAVSVSAEGTGQSVLLWRQKRNKCAYG